MCSICYDKYDVDNYGNQSLLVCGHKYHFDCLKSDEDITFKTKKTAYFSCPQCRQTYIRTLDKFVFSPNYYQKQNIYYKQPPEFLVKAHLKVDDIRERFTKLGGSLTNSAFPIY